MFIVCKNCYNEKNFSIRVSPLGTSVICTKCLNYYAMINEDSRTVEHRVYDKQNNETIIKESY